MQTTVFFRTSPQSPAANFINLNEGSGSFFLLSRLSDWYKAVDEDVRGEQRFFYAEGFPEPAALGSRTSHRASEPLESSRGWTG